MSKRNSHAKRIFALATCVAMLSACGSLDRREDAVAAKLSRVRNVVIIYGENRSFDNLYGLFPGANGIARASVESITQKDHNGNPLPTLPPVWKSGAAPDPAFPSDLPNTPFRIDAPPINLPLNTPTRDLVHRFYENQEQINGGKNDMFAALSDAGGLVMGHYDGSQLALWKIAQQYTLADNFFMAAFGGSFLNHMWLACACTPVFPGAPEATKAQLDTNGRLLRKPGSPSSALKGPVLVGDAANTPDGFAVNTGQPPYQPSRIPPASGGDPRLADPGKHPLPPQTMKTIGDLLSAKGVSWAWYAGAWNLALADGMQDAAAARTVIHNHAPGSPNFQTHHQPYNFFAAYAPGTPARAAHLKDGEDFMTAIKDGALPSVTFYKPQGSMNQHPGYADVLSGDLHIAEVIAKIQTGPQWQNTVIIVTYDENGGFWDHVAPPKGDRWGPGTRIPAIIVSPLARKGFVDSTSYDTTSILKFITRRFDLEALPGLRPGAGDLTNALAP
jgi:acid phosphatase